jgi:hypothetical protein
MSDDPSIRPLNPILRPGRDEHPLIAFVYLAITQVGAREPAWLSRATPDEQELIPTVLGRYCSFGIYNHFGSLRSNHTILIIAPFDAIIREFRINGSVSSLLSP